LLIFNEMENQYLLNYILKKYGKLCCTTLDYSLPMEFNYMKKYASAQYVIIWNKIYLMTSRTPYFFIINF